MTSATNPLACLSPLDGRYRQKLEGLGQMAGEGALVGYRAFVECQWLLHLQGIPDVQKDLRLSPKTRDFLGQQTAETLAAQSVAVKDIEKTTNHDVKAVEYYLQKTLEALGAAPSERAFVHFACTSEDINNLAYALMLKDLRQKRIVPALSLILQDLGVKAGLFADLPMMSRTHGQTASPTTLGKELAVFGHRLKKQLGRLSALKLEGKFNGAVGNYHAHKAAYPHLDWQEIARHFVEERLGLALNPLTTQIENHDSVAEFSEILHHINQILLGLCRDMWGYISLGYFSQRTKAGEVGSSTMPHKVNPIDFENAEGNLGLANALARHFSEKLLISRWQRDLSDSTVLRSLGTMVGHSELAYISLRAGLGKVEVNQVRLEQDLAGAFEVLAEPVQTVMRRFGVVDAYDRLKAATRGQPVDQAALARLIDACSELPEAIKKELKSMTPSRYVGDGPRLARDFSSAISNSAKDSYAP